MRVSVVPTDPGYRVQAYNYSVLLDGVEQTQCITADEEQGYVVRYKTDAHGKLVFNAGTEACETEVVHGKVEIVGP
jgi:hypothetical protein